MIKKVIQSLVLVAFMSTCLYLAPTKVEVEVEEPKPVIRELRAGSVVMPDSVILPSIEKKEVDTVSSPQVDTEEVTEEAVIETVNPEPIYYVDVVNNYITDGSLSSICEFVGYKYDISPEILQAIAWQESQYNVTATGSSGDKGLCQVVERWHRDRMGRLGVYDIYDPYGNVLVCADIVDELMDDKYGYDIRYVLMAYNMGSSNAAGYFKNGIVSDYAASVLRKAEELGYTY